MAEDYDKSTLTYRSCGTLRVNKRTAPQLKRYDQQ